jgi:hypothetical protein
MPYFGSLRRVALVKAEFAQEWIGYIIRLKRIGELGTTLAVTSNRSPLRWKTLCNNTSQRVLVQVTANLFLTSLILVNPCALQWDAVFLRGVCRLLVTASVVPSTPSLVTLMKEALRSSETSVLTRATQRNIQEDTILHSHCRENLKSYIMISFITCSDQLGLITYLRQKSDA